MLDAESNSLMEYYAFDLMHPKKKTDTIEQDKVSQGSKKGPDRDIFGNITKTCDRGGSKKNPMILKYDIHNTKED
ncbi:hypothetical protein AYI68_g7808 [Smittium mucronatum]|uniref:Uncharacterized protein n=1 Tax=Smittium mucronatum TaxID=133383 RepID=A0A1R0GMN8_9FUNG|nr:hypothetical protein AYI68_g7808 [Smittium mucronatum]